MPRLIPMLVAALVLTACSPDEATNTTAAPASTTTTEAPTTTAPTTTVAVASPATTVEVPDGWTEFEGSNYAIALPDLWVDGRAFLDDEEVQQEIAGTLGEFDLGGFESLAESLLANEGVDFLFNLGRTTQSFAENLNILSFPAGVGDALGLAEDLGPAQLESAGATDVTFEVIELERFPALFISYRLADVGVDVGNQYWVATDETVFVLTFSGVEGADPDEWRRMVETFSPR